MINVQEHSEHELTYPQARPELAPAEVAEDEMDWDILESIRKVLRRWKTLAAFTFLGLAFATVASLVMKPWYVAEAVFLPPKAEMSNAEPVSFFFGSSDLSDSYLGMLTSRSVADDVIDHLNLISVFHAKFRVDARAALAGASKFSVNKNSLIVVDVTNGDPKLAADIANAYLAALYRLNSHMVDSASGHREEFFEEQLEEQRQALSRAELDLQRTQEKTGVVLPAGQAQAGLNATAQLVAQIDQASARLAGLLVSSTEQNPEVVEARSQLNELRAELARQQSAPGKHRSGVGLPTNGQLPALTLENGQKERELKLRESVYDSLVQQYERARLAATDPGPQLQVVDVAIPPERKSGPSRRNLVVEGFAVGFAAGLLFVLFGEPARRFLASLRESPAPETR